jgi:putative transposase
MYLNPARPSESNCRIQMQSLIMLLSHRIRLDPTGDQREYFARAAGTARRVWNWGVAESKRQVAAGLRPNAMKLKKQFNAIKYSDRAWLDSAGRPWLCAIHRDAHAQPFAHLANAWDRYFASLHKGVRVRPPVFKKKGRCRDSFYVANDKFRLEKNTAVLPKVGRVPMCECLRWGGKIMGATVSREADHWFLAVQVEVGEQAAVRSRAAEGVIGVDLGVSSFATLSTGEKILGPFPLKAALRRLRIRSRRQTRKLVTAKVVAHVENPDLEKVIRRNSSNVKKGQRSLAKLYARIARIRKDFIHKFTTRLCRENQTVVIEDLNVQGMLANRRMARGISDAGFYELRRQLQYKTQRYGTSLLVADRWFPSSKLCSKCGAHRASLTLAQRAWTCESCGIHHDRDVNAAINLKRLASGVVGSTRTALPVASSTATSNTAAEE